jgi:hypothetical protein
MKQFDITKPYQTRSGLKAEVAFTDMEWPFPFAGRIHRKDETKFPATWGRDGAYGEIGQHEYDLVNVPRTVEVEFWVNVYANGLPSQCLYATHNEADMCARHDRIACIHFKRAVTEGEGL